MQNNFEISPSNNNSRFEQNNSSSNHFAFQEKLFLDGYEITSTVKISDQSLADRASPFSSDVFKEIQSRQINQALYQEAINKITEKLLIEAIFLASIYRYYQQFNSHFYSPWLSQNNSIHYPSDPEDNYPLSPHHLIHKDAKKKSHHSPSSAHGMGEQTFKQWRDNLNTWLLNDTQSLARLGSNNLISEARHNLGKPVWAFTKFASVCQSGYLGCAATVSDLLQHAGVKIPGSASVAGLVSQLNDLGWQKIKISDKHQFHSGDIVFGLNGSHGHIGIISIADKDKVVVCDNSSSSGTLKERTIESGASFTPNGRFAGHLYVMRPGKS